MTIALPTEGLWLISAAGFFLAAALSLRNYLLTKRVSNMWLWLSISLAFITASRLLKLLMAENPLWQDAASASVLIGAVILVMLLFDFEREINLCIKCGSSLTGIPRKEAKKRAEKLIKGF